MSDDLHDDLRAAVSEMQMFSPNGTSILGAASTTADADFKLSDYEPQGTPDDWLFKSTVVMFAIALLLYPVTFARMGGSSIEAFAVYGFVLIVLNLVLIGAVVLTTLQPLHEKWAKAVEKIRAVDKRTACEGVRDTLYTFRHLLKWRRFIKLSRIPFTLGYLVMVVYSAVLLVPEETFPDFFGLRPFAMWALAYYGAVFFFRFAVQGGILSFTDNLDPTSQIAFALATIHQKWEDASSGRLR